MEKIYLPEAIFCSFYNDEIIYGGNGNNHIIAHCASAKHVTATKARLRQPTLGGTDLQTQDKVINMNEVSKKVFSCLFGKVKAAKVSSENITASRSFVFPPNPAVPLKPTPKPIAPHNDRVAKL